MTATHAITESPDGRRRVVWYYDLGHETRGSYGYATEAETRAAEDVELEKLESGEWVVLFAVVQFRDDRCACPECDGWHEDPNEGPLHGIVIEPNDAALSAFADANGWLG